MLAIVTCVLGAALCVLPDNKTEYRVFVPVSSERECVAVVRAVMGQFGKDHRSYVIRCHHKKEL